MSASYQCYQCTVTVLQLHSITVLCWYYWCGGANLDDLYIQLQREHQVVSFFAKVTLCFVMAKCDIVHYYY